MSLVSSRSRIKFVELDSDEEVFAMHDAGAPMNSENAYLNSISDISGVWQKMNPPQSKISLKSGSILTA